MLGTAPGPLLLVDSKEVDFVALAERVLQKWEQLLRSKNLMA